MENSYKFKRETCRNQMVKAGKNSTGKQRHKCQLCKARQVIKKTKSVKKNELKLFVEWINAGIQRCLVHIARDSERKLGKHSPLEINHVFRRHIKKLHCVDTIRKIEIWLDKFDELYDRHKEFIEELTLKIDESTGEAIRQDRTHKNLFSACYMARNVIKKNMLFLHIENKLIFFNL